MAQAGHAQLTLGLFDDASPYTLSLGGDLTQMPTGETAAAEETDPPAALPVTYRLHGERSLAASWRGRAAANFQAIRLLQAIEQEGRAASAEEQGHLRGSRALARPSSPITCSGARAKVPDRLGRARPGAGAAGLAGAADGARPLDQYAHYTPEYLIRAIWTALRRMGFAGGQVLEPGCGTGLFLALVPGPSPPPRGHRRSSRADHRSIAQLLFPHARIRKEDFTRARLAPGFDLAIGNPPFSDRRCAAQTLRDGWAWRCTTGSSPAASSCCARAGSPPSSPAAGPWTRAMPPPAATSPAWPTFGRRPPARGPCAPPPAPTSWSTCCSCANACRVRRRRASLAGPGRSGARRGRRAIPCKSTNTSSASRRWCSAGTPAARAPSGQPTPARHGRANGSRKRSPPPWPRRPETSPCRRRQASARHGDSIDVDGRYRRRGRRSRRAAIS